MTPSIKDVNSEASFYGKDLNNQIKTLLDSMNFQGLIGYLQNWASYKTFPKGFPIDYESLNKLDIIRDLIINRNDIILLIADYGDFIIGANIMNCISIKNVTDKTVYNRFKLLAYVCATIGVECYESTREIEVKDDFFIEKRKQCREKYKNYSRLSKEEIIEIGDEYHHKIKNFLLTSAYLDK